MSKTFDTSEPMTREQADWLARGVEEATRAFADRRGADVEVDIDLVENTFAITVGPKQATSAIENGSIVRGFDPEDGLDGLNDTLRGMYLGRASRKTELHNLALNIETIAEYQEENRLDLGDHLEDAVNNALRNIDIENEAIWTAIRMTNEARREAARNRGSKLEELDRLLASVQA